MSRKRTAVSILTIGILVLSAWLLRPSSRSSIAQETKAAADPLEKRLASQVQPFVERYCVSCHGGKKPKAALDLSHGLRQRGVEQWEPVLERLVAKEMPPEKAPQQPKPAERAAVITWIREFRDREARRNAGDPGIVLARRLSNAEFDYTVRDLTGVDIRPTREFPVDPANQAGFDNSGESLAMSPAMLKKYLAAARHIAEHIVLKPDGFVFAPYPVTAETDRDKYCVQRIVDFYARHRVDHADYFLAAHRHDQGAKTDVMLERIAADAGLSAKYLRMVWSALTDAQADVGPLAVLRALWKELHEAPEQARAGCEQMRDVLVHLRAQLRPDVKKLSVNGISPGSQPMVLWRNRELAKLVPATPTDAEREKLRGALERFCSVFPDTFVIVDRGPYFDAKAAGKGRPLTAGFHLMQGYFRDDGPLYELILDERGRRELDTLWQELDFITLAPMRQYHDFIFFERAEPPRFMFEAEFDFARSEDKDCTSAAKMERLAKSYLAKARKKGASAEALQAIEDYFTHMSADIRKVERDRLAAEPSHLRALVQFAGRAYRRPLTAAEREGLLAFYRRLRQKEELPHEEALADALASVFLSPHFCYRVDLAPPGKVARPLPDYALASRLSYFLWASMPDAELLAHAAKGDLHRPDVLRAQTRRMLRDAKVRGLAAEFAGNWLDIRRFEEHNSVDRDRFPSFTNELRQAMFEEPIRYFIDIAQRDRSVLDLLYGKDTLVNAPLAKHYGIPVASLPRKRGEDAKLPPLTREARQDWVHIEDASRYGRGGLLPMAVFLTKNAPGLRTSPVKRGYWVVRRVLGEQIPPPPPTVPELPKDEAKLGELTLPQVLARHRADPSCAGCHRRFDSVGLVFEGFGPIGERRVKDLGGRPVETRATLPDGKEREGLDGLRAYLREKRQDDFVDNLCRKLFTYALGRSLMLSDRPALEDMRTRLAADGYAFGSLVEAIVTSPQFLNQRGRDDARE